MNMRKMIPITALMLLAGCSGIPTGGHDKFGNETPAFGVATAYEAMPTLHYTAHDRPALITYCHDQHGHISGDGYSCAIAQARVDGIWCAKATVAGHPGDDAWMNAVCDGWGPEEL